MKEGRKEGKMVRRKEWRKGRKEDGWKKCWMKGEESKKRRKDARKERRRAGCKEGKNIGGREGREK